MANGEFRDLPRRIASDKLLRNKTFDIASNPKYDRYQGSLRSMVCKYLDKKSTSFAPSKTLAARDKSASSICINNENMLNQELDQ